MEKTGAPGENDPVTPRSRTSSLASVAAGTRAVMNSSFVTQPEHSNPKTDRKFQPKEVHSLFLFQDTATGRDREERHTAG